MLTARNAHVTASRSAAMPVRRSSTSNHKRNGNSMNKLIAVSAAAIAAATPAVAAAPAFDTPAPVAFMQDANTGAVLFQKDADRRMPPASLAKMMTVYVVFDMIKHGALKPDQQFVMSPETWKKWNNQGSTMFLKAGESVSVDNLLKGIITLSGNDACIVMAEGISGSEQAFTQRMNDAAKKIGLKNSYFGTANGWPDNGVTYITARDIATLAEATIRDFPDLYKRYYGLPDFTWGTQMNGKAIDQSNRDPLIGNFPGADGLKTGHTDEAGYSFTGSAIQNGRRLVLVLAGLTSFNQRKDESIKFMTWGFHAWQDKPIVKQGKLVSTAEVQLGSATQVGLVAPQDLSMTMPSGVMNSDMQAKVVYDGPIKAPIAAGQHIADLVITTPDAGEQHLPLVAATDVPAAGFFGRAWAGLKSLL
jgi:serine-type D-Ala-D-Ala carboxypeptidase (penicillin-binding protein 5/6)